MIGSESGDVEWWEWSFLRAEVPVVTVNERLICSFNRVSKVFKRQ